MRCIPRIRGGVLLLVLGAVRAPAQAPDPLAILVKLDQTSRLAVEAAIDSARTSGLPWRILLSRAQEAIAKKAENRQTVNAVRLRLASLRDARAVLGNVTDQDLGAAAALLEAKVKPEQLAPFKNPPRGRTLTSALTVLGDLVTKSIPAEEASSAIYKLWQGGAGDADFMGLYRNVESDILQGLSPGTALQNRMRETLGGRPAPPAGELETPSP